MEEITKPSKIASSDSNSVSDLLAKINSNSNITVSEFQNQLWQKVKNLIFVLGKHHQTRGEVLEIGSKASSISNKRFAGAFAKSQSFLNSTSKSKTTELAEQRDLEDFFLNSGLPAEALSFTVELKNSGESGIPGSGEGDEEGVKNRNLILKISSKLLESWVNFNCLAETLVRFSILETNSAETANFSRNLFALPTKFQVSRQEFPSFLCQQLVLAVQTLSKFIQGQENQYQHENPNQSQNQVRTGFLSSILDRLFLRFHTDQENFYPFFEEVRDQDLSEDQISSTALKELVENDPFINFVIDASRLVNEDFIARRLLGKILLGLGQSPVSKIAKTVIFTESFCDCPATKILYPPEEFLLRKNETWKHVLLASLPLKTRLHNFPFFTTWSRLILYATENATESSELLEIWRTLLSSWSQLIVNSYSDIKTIVSSTCAVVCLCKALKNAGQESFLFNSGSSAGEKNVLVPVFNAVQKCLGSTDQERQACGMAVGQIVADLIKGNDASPAKPPKTKTMEEELLQGTGLLQHPTADSKPSDGNQSQSQDAVSPAGLKFESHHLRFLQFVSFYECQSESRCQNTVLEVRNYEAKNPRKNLLTPRNLYGGLMTELDSDDDEDDDDDDQVADEDFKGDESSPSGFKAYDMSNDTPMSEELLNLKNTDKKIPVYFSDICEILLESAGSSTKDEAVVEILKKIAIMKIPVLLSLKVRIDASVAKDLGRALAELESGSILEIPVICGLYEMSCLYPIEICQSLGHLAFDRNHYSAGHRMAILARFSEVTQLLSKQKCFSCFSEKTGKLDRLLENIHPPFIRDYMMTKRKLRKCSSCAKIEGVATAKSTTTKTATSTAAIKKEEVKSKTEIKSPGDTALDAGDKLMLASLPWREVIERRLAAKTRRFGDGKSKVKSESVDVYSAKYVPIVWASLANRLIDQENLILLLNCQHADSLSFALFTAQAFRCLGIIILGTSGVYCPHLRNIAAQSAELVSLYSRHSDAEVRRAVLSLLATIISKSEAKQFIMEIFLNSANNLFEQLALIYENDTDGQNRHLFANLKQLATASAMIQLGQTLQN